MPFRPASNILSYYSEVKECVLIYHLPQQQLALSRPPVWDVEQVLLNRSENCLALVGRRGVAVVDLPQRSGTPPLFDKGRETITCKLV